MKHELNGRGDTLGDSQKVDDANKQVAVEPLATDTGGTDGEEQLDENIWAVLCNHQKMEDSLPTSRDNEDAEDKPKIEFIDGIQWEHFVTRIERNKRENQTLIEISKAIIAAGGCSRLLQTLDADSASLIDSFEDAFPNFGAVADLLRDYFALSNAGNREINFPALLLVGEAGVGKTEAARWLSQHLNVPFRLIDMASAQTGSALSGSEKFWSNSRVGQVFEVLAYERFANPLVMLDELDKVVQDSRYDPLAPLYTLLEPSSAQRFIDLSISDFAIDASHINWIATANQLSNIPLPIQSRFTIIDIAKPNEAQAAKIALNIYKRLLNESSWGSHFKSELNEDVIDTLLNYPPRTVKSILSRALGSAIRNNRSAVACCDLVLPKSVSSNGIGFLARHNTL